MNEEIKRLKMELEATKRELDRTKQELTELKNKYEPERLEFIKNVCSIDVDGLKGVNHYTIKAMYNKIDAEGFATIEFKLIDEFDYTWDEIERDGGKYKHPILKFYTGGEKSLDYFVIELNQELIEYIWNEIGHPCTGLLYGYTNNYKANWED